MFLAIGDGDFHIDDGIAGDGAIFHDRLDAFFDAGLIRGRHRPADDLPRELIALAARRLDAHVDFTELTRPARLFLVAVHRRERPRDRFTIRNPARDGHQIDAELRLGAAHGHIDVAVTQTFQHRLLGAGIVEPVQRGVFFDEAREGRPHLRRIGGRLRLDGDRDQRARIRGRRKR